MNYLQTTKQAIKSIVPQSTINQLQYLILRINRSKNRFLRAINGHQGKKACTNISIRKFRDGKNATFFGYFDKTPYSKDDTKLLACSTRIHNRTPHSTDILNLGWFEIDNPKQFNVFGKTSTWCWQQGCMLQWFPSNENELVLYNRPVTSGRHGAVIQNILTGSVEAEFDRTIYCLSSTGKTAISLNFARLHQLRPGYGYAGLDDLAKNILCPENDGIWTVNLETGSSTLLHSIRDLAAINPQPSMEGAWHYLNHAVFNPSGSRFVIFHLWAHGTKRFVRMFTCDHDGSNLFLLTNGSMVSHFAWKSNNQLLAFANHPENGDAFYLHVDQTNDRKIVAPTLITADGHPSYNPHQDILLCDTYPDMYGEQHLFLMIEEQRRIDLARFTHAASLDGEFRCDLHPRWNRSGGQVCVDCSTDGRRAIFTIDLGSNFKP